MFHDYCHSLFLFLHLQLLPWENMKQIHCSLHHHPFPLKYQELNLSSHLQKSMYCSWQDLAESLTWFPLITTNVKFVWSLVPTLKVKIEKPVKTVLHLMSMILWQNLWHNYKASQVRFTWMYTSWIYHPWNVSKCLSISQTSTLIINKISTQLIAVSLLCLSRYCCYAPNNGHCLKALGIYVITLEPVNTYQQTNLDPTVQASWSEDTWSIHTRQTIFIIDILLGLTIVHKTNIINFHSAIMAIFIKI